MVSTHVTNIGQLGSSPQPGANIKNMRNHHLDNIVYLAMPKAPVSIHAKTVYVFPWFGYPFNGSGLRLRSFPANFQLTVFKLISHLESFQNTHVPTIFFPPLQFVLLFVGVLHLLIFLWQNHLGTPTGCFQCWKCSHSCRMMISGSGDRW